MRNRFDEQLEVLNLELIKMGSLCEDAISAAITALLDSNGDADAVKKVFEADGMIDRKEREIENLCIRLLLQQQPVAKDLRVISSAMKMISDMERIGDQASDIAEMVKYINTHAATGKVHLREMAAAATKMVTDSVDSFVKKDLELARSVIAYDDVVDKLFETVKTELIAIISKNEESGIFCVDLLMTAKYLERIGDHAVNIAEWVEYSITGIHRKDGMNLS